MKVSRKAVVGLGALATAASALALMASPHGVSAAKADASKIVGPARVDDFMLADQDLLGRQLYRMADDKAVVLVTYATGDKQLRADAKALMALKAAYSGQKVDMLAVDSRIGDRRDAVVADAKAAGLDMPILFDYEQLVGEELGVTYTLENLNLLDHPGCPFGTTEDVLALVSAVNRPQLRINLDLYHTQIGEGDLVRWCQKCLPWIGEMQVADNPGRCEPGTGEINYRGVALALKKMGYRGPVGMEAFAAGDADAALEAFRDAFTV